MVQDCSTCPHHCGVMQQGLGGEVKCSLGMRGMRIMVTKDRLSFIDSLTVHNYLYPSLVRIKHVYPLPFDFAIPSTRMNDCSIFCSLIDVGIGYVVCFGQWNVGRSHRVPVLG